MAATLSDALSWWAHETPDNAALLVADEQVTFAELDRWVSAIACDLVARGVRPGDRVGTLAGTSVAHCALLLGVIRAGAICNALSVRLSDRETREFYEHTQPKWVFLGDDQAAKQAVVDAIGATALPLAGVKTLRTAAADGPVPVLDADAPVGIIATSGSTARPKGVVYTHRSMLAYAAEFAVEEPFSGPGARALALSPIATSAGFVQLMEFITLGATLRFEAVFDAERALHLLETERVSMFQGVPLFFERIAACPGFAKADLSALRYTSVGGAPVSRTLLETWMRKGCLLRQIYGQTEAGGAISIMSKRDAAAQPSKAGRGGMFTQLAIIDVEGRFLPSDTPGQIVIRGPSVMKGYWNDPETTAKTLVDGWLRTGDVGSLDVHGYLTFIDRMKDIIISGGLNISAAEVERVVAEFAGVVEVAVLGAPDAKFGETPLAIVHATVELSIPALIAHCNASLADYKVPRYVVVAPEPLPRLATGKIAKPALREHYLPMVPGLARVR